MPILIGNQVGLVHFTYFLVLNYESYDLGFSMIELLSVPISYMRLFTFTSTSSL